MCIHAHVCTCMWVQACKARHKHSELTDESEQMALPSTTPLLQPSHGSENRLEHLSMEITSQHWWLPGVLRIKAQSLLVTSLVTSSTHNRGVPSPSAWMMPSLSWHCTLSLTVPFLLLVLISAWWVTYLFLRCLPLPTEHKPSSACTLPSLMSSIRSAEQCSVRICWVNLLLCKCWSLLLTSSKQKMLHF